jgi:uncharacterized protein related to proFAR isomerase
MQIIPVLDLLGGVVVRGVRGDRANYRPIATPLAATAEPLAVARGLLGLGRFKAMYIADLDAIAGRAPDAAALAALCAAFPATEFWLDAGVATAAAARALLKNPQVTVVLGSESVEDASVVAAFAGDSRAVLSLDFRGGDFVGPPALAEAADLWPARVIAMTLARVGSGAGPDLARLRDIRARAGKRAVFAAGGVRGAEDLERLAAAAIDGALVASCLHDGTLDRAALARFGTQTPPDARASTA